MRPLRKLFSLSTSERRLLFEAVFLILTIRLGLQLLSLRTLGRALARLERLQMVCFHVDASSPEDIARAVARASARVPRATCLIRALAIHALLERRGHPSRLRLGFVRDRNGGLRGHAWVESGGGVVVGGGEVLRYNVLPLEQDDAR